VVVVSWWAGTPGAVPLPIRYNISSIPLATIINPPFLGGLTGCPAGAVGEEVGAPNTPGTHHNHLPGAGGWAGRSATTLLIIIAIITITYTCAQALFGTILPLLTPPGPAPPVAIPLTTTTTTTTPSQLLLPLLLLSCPGQQAGQAVQCSQAG
jgi:hypothetical protein